MIAFTLQVLASILGTALVVYALGLCALWAGDAVVRVRGRR